MTNRRQRRARNAVSVSTRPDAQSCRFEVERELMGEAEVILEFIRDNMPLEALKTLTLIQVGSAPDGGCRIRMVGRNGVEGTHVLPASAWKRKPKSQWMAGMLPS